MSNTVTRTFFPDVLDIKTPVFSAPPFPLLREESLFFSLSSLLLLLLQDAVGWRPEAKHLLLLMTDQPSHLALDSRLAGIVVPHDGRCHLENNIYTGSTWMVRSSITTNYTSKKESTDNNTSTKI